MNKSSFEDILERDGRLIYTNVGVSMMPLIRQGRDLMVIERPQGRLKRLDVPLYKRDSGKYVLHRILRVRQEDYVICGDNCWKREYGITDSHIIGVLTAVIRDGREIPVTAWGMRMYAHLWCDFFPVRAGIIRLARFSKRCLRRVRKCRES